MVMANEGFGALAAYRTVAGIDAAPEEFMKMATDALRTFLLQAENAIGGGDLRAKAAALNSAARIVEFMLGLSGSEPGPLSDGLAQVYRYVLAAILQANCADDSEAVAAGRVAVEQLAAVWRRAFPDMDRSQTAFGAVG
jgi:flagellar biosynthetic protein FliS